MRGRPKGAIAGGMFVVAAAMPMPLWAQIKTDGTVGPARSLTGPNFTIGADLGRQVGGNLFHSFSTFNVKTGESATFAGPNSVANIIGRVTGGATSSVDGKIASTIAGANLFLINPAGWVFGSHASIDVQGSFHVSSADYLRHSDGVRFQATTANGSSFTSAPPEAFGFLGPNAGKITVSGSSLVTSAGKNLSMVGGPVQIIGGRVAAPAGQVHVASVAGPGEIGVNPADAAKVTARTFGSVDITSGATVEASDQTTQQGGGAVYIRGGAITVDNSTVQSQNFGDAPGNLVSVQAGGLSLSNGGTVQTTTSGAGAGGPVQVDAAQATMTSSGEVATRSLGPGTAGSITTSAGHITIDGTDDAPGPPAGIISRAQSAGDSGAVSVSANNISISSSGQISSVTGAGGKAGDVTVTGTGPASTISIDGHGMAPTGIGSVANPGSTGAAGTVSVTAGSMSLAEGGQISAETSGAGKAGNVQMTATGPASTLTIDGGGTTAITGILSQAAAGSTGDGGDITINAGTLSLTGTGQISSSTFSSGDAGRTTIAADSIAIDGSHTNSDGAGTGIFSNSNVAGNGGNAGQIVIRAKTVDLGVQGFIQTNSSGAATTGSVTVTGPAGGGAGLALTIDDAHAPAGRPSGISAINTNGPGGTVTVAADDVALLNGGEITTSTIGAGDAGTTSVTAGHITAAGAPTDAERTGISSDTYAPAGGGKAGPVVIRANTVDLGVNAGISSSTFGNGAAGNVTVTGPSGTRSGLQLTIDDAHSPNGATSGIFSQGARGNAGTVTVLADTINLLNGGDISTGATGVGNAGEVSVTAGQINASAAPNDVFASGIFSNAGTGSTGNAGDVFVNADSISLSEQGVISSSTFGSGNAGAVSVDARQITARGSAADFRPTGIFSLTFPQSNGGNAGQVVVRSNSITLGANGQISSSSFNNGAGGSVTVTGRSGTGAGLGITVDGGNAAVDSGIFSEAEALNSGPAGDVAVVADKIALMKHGIIGSRTFGAGNAGKISVTAGQITIDGPNTDPLISGITSDAETLVSDLLGLGGGNGGNILIQAGQLSLNGEKSEVSASDIGQHNAGDITIDSDKVMLNSGAISTSALQGDGGNITVRASSLFYVNRGLIATAVTTGNGGGGNIIIDPPLIALNQGLISADAHGGPGGNITVANPFIATPDSQVSASSDLSTAGTIDITTPVTGLASNLAPLSEKTVAAHVVSHTACDAAARAAKAPSTIVLAGRGGLPEDAEGPQGSGYFAGERGQPEPDARSPSGNIPALSGGGSGVACAAQ